MRSEIDSASSWSCVTKIVVMPSSFWIGADFLAQRHAHLGVERRQRLVEQQQLRLRRQRAGQRHALLLAAGKLVGIAVAELRQLDELQHLGDALVGLRLWHAGDLEAEGDVLRDRQVGEQRIGLEHHADIALVGLQPGDVLAADDDRAGGRLLEAGDHAQHRRLAAARRSEEGDELAGADIEVEILHDRGRCRRTFADVLDAEEGVGHGVRLSGQFGRFADFGAKRDRTWITDMQPQVMAKAMMASAAGS